MNDKVETAFEEFVQPRTGERCYGSAILRG